MLEPAESRITEYRRVRPAESSEDLMRTMLQAQDLDTLNAVTGDVLSAATRADEATVALVPIDSGVHLPSRWNDRTPCGAGRSLTVVLQENGCHATIVTCRRGRCDFVSSDLERAERVSTVLRGAWLAMSHRQQARRLADIIASGVGPTRGVILVDHAQLRILHASEQAMAALGDHTPRSRPGSALPEPLRGLVLSARAVSAGTGDPHQGHVLAGATVQIYCADPSFGGEVVLVRPSQPRPQVELTARQREVISLVSEGLSNQQIASQLNISVATVKKHLEMIYSALGVTNRTAAVHHLQPSATVARLRCRADLGLGGS